MDTIALAIDIGGSKCIIGLVDHEGSVLCERRFFWDDLCAETVVRDIILVARELLQEHPDLTPTLVGATIPGLADPKTGIWVEASFSGIRDLPIADLLHQAFNLPVYIDNDGQACAIAEKMYGSCKDADDFLYITVSNGVGGALFLDGTLYRGAIGNAGEIGHCVVVEDGRPCKCGSNGCLEAYAAGPAIVQNYVEQGGSPEIDGMPADAKRIAQCAREGDAAAVRAFILEGQYLGKMIATAANLFNPQKVVIGGGISLAFDIYGGILKRTVSDYLYIKANPGLEILPTPLGYYGGLLGAAAVAFVGPDKYQAR